MALIKKTRRSKYRSEFKGDHFFDYKNPLFLYRFVSEGGRITPSRVGKLSLNQQRKLARAIKKSRNLNMLPCGGRAYDDYGFPEPISPKPFSMD